MEKIIKIINGKVIKMEKLTKKEVEEVMLQEIEDYIEMNGINMEDIGTPTDLLEALADFRSSIFIEYMEQENKELMWDIEVDNNNLPKIHIMEV